MTRQRSPQPQPQPTPPLTAERRREIENLSCLSSTVDQAIDDLLDEIDRLTVVANEFAVQVAEGPLACEYCGERFDSTLHSRIEQCALTLSGLGCREPERHHTFEPKDPL